MTTSKIPTYLVFAQLQMAAEAIYKPGFTKGAIAPADLVNGNGRASTKDRGRSYIHTFS